MTKLTKEQKNWLKYEKVRRSGEFNMFMEAQQAAAKAGLSLNDYSEILRRYSFIKETMTEEEIENELSK